MPAECRSCHAPIDWAVSQDGLRAHPVDHDSEGDPRGNLEVWRDGQGLLRWRALRKGEDPKPGRHRGMTHYATCPDAAEHRRSR